MSSTGRPLGTKEATMAQSMENHDVEMGDGYDSQEKDLTNGNDVKAPAFERTTTGFKWFLVVLATMSSMFLYALDNTIVADVVPSITKDLGNSELLPWLSVGFMIGGVAVALPFGKLFGLYNVKWLYIISLALFMIGSALCGAAPTMNAMIVGRVIAGIGGNGMYLGVITLLSVNTTEQERPMYLGLVYVLSS